MAEVLTRMVQTQFAPNEELPALDGEAHLTSFHASPFLRWAGSKRRLLPQIAPHLPSTFERYIEPFLGAGSLFLYLAPSNAILNDACAPLIDTWLAIQRNPFGVYKEATKRRLTQDEYYAARAERGGGYLQRAGRFIYLNRGAFNGLYRVNLEGTFNVPWGSPKTGNICTLQSLVEVSTVLRSSDVSLTAGDFAASLTKATEGDLIFLDPPYVTSHNNNGFIEYNERIFSWNDQIRLSQAAYAARNSGATVLVTNAHHQALINLYHDFEVVHLTRYSTLAADKTRRRPTSEVLLIGRPR